MNYAEKVEQAIAMFNQLPESMTHNEFLSIEKEMKDNDVALYLLDVLQDEHICKEDFDLPKAVSKNTSQSRLGNYSSFKKSIEKMKKNEIMDFSGLRFAMRHTDEEEQEVYRSIICKRISIGSPGPSPAESLVTNKASTTIQEGNRGSVETYVLPKDAPQEVEVISLDTNIATVELLKEKNGKKVWSVSGIEQGKTTLCFQTVSEPFVSREVSVTVKPIPQETE